MKTPNLVHVTLTFPFAGGKYVKNLCSLRGPGPATVQCEFPETLGAEWQSSRVSRSVQTAISARNPGFTSEAMLFAIEGFSATTRTEPTEGACFFVSWAWGLLESAALAIDGPVNSTPSTTLPPETPHAMFARRWSVSDAIEPSRAKVAAVGSMGSGGGGAAGADTGMAFDRGHCVVLWLSEQQYPQAPTISRTAGGARSNASRRFVGIDRSSSATASALASLDSCVFWSGAAAASATEARSDAISNEILPSLVRRRSSAASSSFTRSVAAALAAASCREDGFGLDLADAATISAGVPALNRFGSVRFPRWAPRPISFGATLTETSAARGGRALPQTLPLLPPPEADAADEVDRPTAGRGHCAAVWFATPQFVQTPCFARVAGSAAFKRSRRSEWSRSSSAALAAFVAILPRWVASSAAPPAALASSSRICLSPRSIFLLCFSTSSRSASAIRAFKLVAPFGPSKASSSD